MKIFRNILRGVMATLGLCCAFTILADGAANFAKFTVYRRGQSPSDNEKVYPSLKPLFDRSLDKYPVDVRLFENEQFVSRLTDLVGSGRVEYMRHNFDFEYPIEYVQNFYSIMACKSRMCGTTDFEIQYFPVTNNLCIKYNLNGESEIYMEKPTKVRWTEYTDEEDTGM